MKKTFMFLLIYCNFCYSQLLPSQGEKNCSKYWRYRERIKDFVVSENCQGCGCISSIRAYWKEQNNFGNIEGNLHFPDATISIGHYIGVLATEWKLLKKHGYNAEAENTLRDLYYELETINRLDYGAEFYWGQYCCGPTQGNLNGFFIRQDVPTDFPHNMLNGDLIRNHLTSSYFPLDDDRKVKYTSSDFANNIFQTQSGFGGACSSQNGLHPGPVVESLDQVTQIFLGLSLCAKFLNTNLSATKNGTVLSFRDGETDVLHEVKNIANRIVNWAAYQGSQANYNLNHPQNWTIINPNTGNCASGGAAISESGSHGCKCMAGGSKFKAFSFGLALTNCHIQNVPAHNFGDDFWAADYWQNHYVQDQKLHRSAQMWDHFFKQVCIGNEDYKVLTLAATGNSWEGGTGLVLVNRCATEFVTNNSPLAATSTLINQIPSWLHPSWLPMPDWLEDLTDFLDDLATDPDVPMSQFKGDRLHLPLLHKVLYEDYPDDYILSYPKEFYSCMIDKAQCFGPKGYDNNLIWSANQGVSIYGYQTEASSDEFDGISYMLYYNLYNLAYPSTYYEYKKPFDLCENDIVKQGFMGIVDNTQPFFESEKKTFIAGNSLTAMAGATTTAYPNGVPYIIKNDPDYFGLSSLYNADVTFMAKNEINLHSGFEANAGINFQASINPLLNTIKCDCPNSVNKDECENYIAAYRSMINNGNNNSSSQSNLSQSFYSQYIEQEDQKTNKNKVSYHLMPNPNNGTFTINKSINDGVAFSVTVIDILGNVVGIWKTAESKLEVNVNEQAAGVYFVKIESEEKTTMQKIIKQ